MASPNFTEEELSVMLEHISFHVVILSSAHINSVTQAKKNEIWKNIANEVSSLGVANREIKDKREKWRQLKSAVLSKKSKEINRTRGGSLPPPIPFEDIIRGILVAGVQGKRVNYSFTSYFRLICLRHQIHCHTH